MQPLCEGLAVVSGQYVFLLFLIGLVLFTYSQVDFSELGIWRSEHTLFGAVCHCCLYVLAERVCGCFGGIEMAWLRCWVGVCHLFGRNVGAR